MEPIIPVVLVSCGKQKLSVPAPAKDLYVSERFLEARKFAELYGKKWFVLSAKHGVVAPEEILDPYDVDLETLPLSDKQAWADRVVSSLSKKGLIVGHHLIVLASGAYSTVLHSKLQAANALATYPFNNLPPGAETDILARVNGNPVRLNHYGKFYDLLMQLQNLPQQMIPFHELNSKQLSKAGVYFFFDRNESTRFYSQETLRVVRIGTHGVSGGSKSLLWQRLRTHRGNDDGTGSHRSSIFRLHVGNAILASQNRSISSWGIGDNASKDIRTSERELEIEVSRYLGDLLVAHLPIVDAASADSDRSYIEKNSISLLTEGGPIDAQSTRWLGNFSSVRQIKNSGLWNVNYVGDGYDPHFLTVFEQLIERYKQGRISEESLAPPNWRVHMQRGAIGQQDLF